MRVKKQIFVLCLGIIIFVSLFKSTNFEQTLSTNSTTKIQENSSIGHIQKLKNNSIEIPGKMWISMSMCWGRKEKIWNKFKFPYPLAGQLSTKLWNRIFPNVNILFHLLICEENINQPFDEYNLSEYIKSLNESRAYVITTKIKNCKQCALRSQITRMLAYNLPEIAKNDMVILSDVDAFPINKKLLDPIYENPNKKIWIYSYDDTLNHGISFNMKFTAMRSETWKNILYQANSFENLLSIFSEKLNIKTNTLSYRILYDQFIMSRAILDSKLCYLPANNLLWPQLNTDPILKTEENSNDDDKDTCYYGHKLSECNKSKNDEVHLKQCLYWHFTPEDRKQDLQKKYRQIIEIIDEKN